MMMRLVCSDVNAPVENREIAMAHTTAGHQRWSHRWNGATLVGPLRVDTAAIRFVMRAPRHYSSR